MAPEVLAAWIGFAGTLIAAWVASVIGKRWLHQERLKDPLQQAKEDIRFLLEVERIQAEKSESQASHDCAARSAKDGQRQGACMESEEHEEPRRARSLNATNLGVSTTNLMGSPHGALAHQRKTA